MLFCLTVKKEYQEEVRRNNTHLVEHMTNINTRVGISEAFGGLNFGMNLKSPKSFRIQSMNYITRKKEMARINDENKSLSRKIGEAKADLLKSKFDEDFKVRKGLIKNISRSKFIENIAMI